MSTLTSRFFQTVFRGRAVLFSALVLSGGASIVLLTSEGETRAKEGGPRSETPRIQREKASSVDGPGAPNVANARPFGESLSGANVVVELPEVASPKVVQFRDGDPVEHVSSGSLPESPLVRTKGPGAGRARGGASLAVVELDSATPGASLHVDGRRVLVEGYFGTEESPDPSLSVLIEDTAGAEPTDHSSKTEEPTASEAAEPEPAAPRHHRGPARGMTYEEELFRTKWGWAAYEDARRAALAEPEHGEAAP